MQPGTQIPLVEFAVITNKNYRLKLGTDYPNTYYQAYEAK